MAEVALKEKAGCLSVSELNRRARQHLETGFSMLRVQGEVSNKMLARSGHLYFSLKDSNAQVRCVMWRTRIGPKPVTWQEGDCIEVSAQVTLYEGRGDYQLNVLRAQKSGVGHFYEDFLALKQQLEREGVFAQAQRALPMLVRRIGIVTSPNAAVLRDVVQTTKRRYPGVQLIVYPAVVQGAEAPASLQAAVSQANFRAEVQVLLLCRGGGSTEDLWGFNDAALARTLAASGLPIVSAVGHETDVTIADFAADIRASTPTAAAELVTEGRLVCLGRLAAVQAALVNAIRRCLRAWFQRVDLFAARLVSPVQRLQTQRQALNALQQRLQQAWHAVQTRNMLKFEFLLRRCSASRVAVSHWRQKAAILQQRCQQVGNALLEPYRTRWTRLQDALSYLDIARSLQRGYALVQDEGGQAVRSVKDLHCGGVLRVLLADGTLEVVLSRVIPEEVHRHGDFE